MARRPKKLLPTALAMEVFGRLLVDELRPLAKLVQGGGPLRKPEMVQLLATYITNPETVRSLYAQLKPEEQLAVQEATHELEGRLRPKRFVARYGKMPELYHLPSPNAPWNQKRETGPTILHLFFPMDFCLPSDVRSLLLPFVPRPPDFQLPTQAETPVAVRKKHWEYQGHRSVEVIEDLPLRVRLTAPEAEQDLRAVLRLIEAGRLRVSDKKRLPSVASQRAVGEVLAGGDFYTAADEEKPTYDPAHDLGIKVFAWPMLVQAGGLAQPSGDALALTPAGRKALSGRAPEVLRSAYRKWASNQLFDEFSRIELIKGQGKGGLSALTGRRKAVLDGLADCPPGEWFTIADFFRFLRATDQDFVLTRRQEELYIGEQRYGSMLYRHAHTWEQLQGRYILAVLFEYVATLGLIDVAYLAPQCARDDFQGRWGTDDLTCFSRYDGLVHLRINPLGAWCMGSEPSYEAAPLPVADVLQVLPNLDIVVKQPPLPAGDRLLLERYAEPRSEGVWQLTPARVQAVLEQGGDLDELEEFLRAHSTTPLPQTAEVFLRDQRARGGKLRDLGTARLLECVEDGLAPLLANDSSLRGKVHVADGRWLVFQHEDEAAVRRALRRLGYVLPPPRG